VIGTASEGKHEFLRSLGAAPTVYGEGLAERVARLAPEGVDAAIDMVGSGSLPALIDIVGDPANVISIADPDAAAQGATYVRGGGNSSDRLAEAARLGQQGAYTPRVEATYTLSEAAAAQAHSETGHAQGRIVVLVGM
jgi:NADPH:quinone reductase-like Zn-dependent oxidoreductase